MGNRLGGQRGREALCWATLFPTQGPTHADKRGPDEPVSGAIEAENGKKRGETETRLQQREPKSTPGQAVTILIISEKEHENEFQECGKRDGIARGREASEVETRDDRHDK